MDQLKRLETKESKKDQIALHLQTANTLDDAEFIINKERKEELKRNEASG